MLLAGLLASVEHGLNRVLRMDSTALPRLAALEGKIIAIDCRQPALQLYILPGDEGLMLASHWETEADCTLRAPASSLLQLALSQDKPAVLHSPQVELEGDSAVLLDLVGVLQDLELDWEYELSRWLGPVATQMIGGHLRSRALDPPGPGQPQPEPWRIPGRRGPHPGRPARGRSALRRARCPENRCRTPRGTHCAPCPIP